MHYSMRSAEFAGMRIMTLLSNACNGKGVSHTAAELCEGMARHVPVRLYVHSLCDGYRSPIVVPSVPAWSNALAYRVERLRPFMNARTLKRYLADIREGDICWIWPGTVQEAAPVVRKRGGFIATEAINCHQGTARRILRDAYARYGWPAERMPSAEDIAIENRDYEFADVIFAPGPNVVDSMRENDVPMHKVIATSYGWSPRRFAAANLPRSRSAGKEVSVLFVGWVCVRKGAHLLAQAWRAAGVDGRLLFAGKLEPPLTFDLLAGQGTEFLGYTSRVPELMASSDIFAFPTLEEGSPMVSYEAAAMGLAIVTSPMGAGAFIRDGVEGLVVDPYDHQGWVEALRRLSAEPALRRRLGEAARLRAQEFTWDLVAERRLRALKERIASTADLAAAG